MSRRLLMISKDPEFDDQGEVVLGQCEPFTSGWRLVMLSNGKNREILLSGTYTDLRKIQEHCASLADPAAVRKRVMEMRALLNSSVTETVAVDFNAPSSESGSTKILEPTQTGMLAAVPENVQQVRGGGFFEVTEKDGAIVALVADPDRLADLGEFNQNLRQLFESKPKAIVLDLSRIQNLASRAVNELVLFRDRCTEESIGFALCNVRKSVQKLFDSLDHENPPAVYADSEAALAGIAETK